MPAHAPAASAAIVQPDGGKALRAYGDEIHVMLGGAQTGGSLTVSAFETAPGGGPPHHVHSKDDEVFLVGEGRLAFFAGGVWTEVRPGGVVYLPRGTAHCFRNVGRTPARGWVLTLPAGFDRFFERSAELFAREAPPSMEAITRVAGEHGIRFLAPAPDPA